MIAHFSAIHLSLNMWALEVIFKLWRYFWGPCVGVRNRDSRLGERKRGKRSERVAPLIRKFTLLSW